MTKLGFWKHWKTGNFYRVLFNAKVATNGPRDGRTDVVYLDPKDDTIYTRDEEEWNQWVWLEALPHFHKRGDAVFDPTSLNESEYAKTAERFTYVGAQPAEFGDIDVKALRNGESVVVNSNPRYVFLGEDGHGDSPKRSDP